MDLDMQGRRALVTGGTRGIGRAISLALAQAGASVITCHRQDVQSAEALARELEDIGGGHAVVRADARDQADVGRLVACCRDRLGGLDVLVNNVGVDAMAPLTALPLEEWRGTLTSNITSMFLVTQAVLPLLGTSASIVNIGSALATRGLPMRTHYTASKAAVIGFTRSLCKELGERGVRVNTVAPGIVETEPGAGLPPQLHQRFTAMTPLGRLAQPEDVAGAVLFLTSDLSRFVTGVTLAVDGGI